MFPVSGHRTPCCLAAREAISLKTRMPLASIPMTKLSLYFMLSLLRDEPTIKVSNVTKHQWTYNGEHGPDHWASKYPSCGNKRQSPIDIRPALCEHKEDYPEFRFHNYDQLSTQLGVGTHLNFTNSGHSASVRISGNMSVDGGGLVDQYNTAEFHFHWGKTSDVGSEHAIDGVKFPLEMHVVNYASKYEDLAKAMNQPNGLAVLAVMFQISDNDNPAFEPLASALKYIHKTGDYEILGGVSLHSLLPSDTSRFYRYSGSLTTPRCYETVEWTIFAEPQKISTRQLQQFRDLYEDSHVKGDGLSNPNTPTFIRDNWRPLQPLNGRVVHRSFPLPSNPSQPSEDDIAGGGKRGPNSKTTAPTIPAPSLTSQQTTPLSSTSGNNNLDLGAPGGTDAQNGLNQQPYASPLVSAGETNHPAEILLQPLSTSAPPQPKASANESPSPPAETSLSGSTVKPAPTPSAKVVPEKLEQGLQHLQEQYLTRSNNPPHRPGLLGSVLSALSLPSLLGSLGGHQVQDAVLSNQPKAAAATQTGGHEKGGLIDIRLLSDKAGSQASEPASLLSVSLPEVLNSLKTSFHSNSRKQVTAENHVISRAAAVRTPVTTTGQILVRPVAYSVPSYRAGINRPTNRAPQQAPYVFLHNDSNPVRIARPLYDALYNRGR